VANTSQDDTDSVRAWSGWRGISSLEHSADILANMSMMTSMPESIADHFANGVSL
jgi:hypothetical protein